MGAAACRCLLLHAPGACLLLTAPSAPPSSNLLPRPQVRELEAHLRGFSREQLHARQLQLVEEHLQQQLASSYALMAYKGRPPASGPAAARACRCPGVVHAMPLPVPLARRAVGNRCPLISLLP